MCGEPGDSCDCVDISGSYVIEDVRDICEQCEAPKYEITSDEINFPRPGITDVERAVITIDQKNCDSLIVTSKIWKILEENEYPDNIENDIRYYCKGKKRTAGKGINNLKVKFRKKMLIIRFHQIPDFLLEWGEF